MPQQEKTWRLEIFLTLDEFDGVVLRTINQPPVGPTISKDQSLPPDMLQDRVMEPLGNIMRQLCGQVQAELTKRRKQK